MTNKLGLKNWVAVEGSPGIYVERPRNEQTRSPATPAQVERREQAFAKFDRQVAAVKAQILKK